MVLGQDVFEPEGEMFFRMEAGDVTGGGMEDDIEGFAFGLPLHRRDWHIQIEMLSFQMAKLMLQYLVLPFVRKERVDIDIKGAVIIGDADALHLAGQGYMADEIINHNSKGKQRYSVFLAECLNYFYSLTYILGACILGKFEEHTHIFPFLER